MVVVGGMDGVFVVVFGGVVYVEWCGGCVFLIWYVWVFIEDVVGWVVYKWYVVLCVLVCDDCRGFGVCLVCGVWFLFCLVDSCVCGCIDYYGGL